MGKGEKVSILHLDTETVPDITAEIGRPAHDSNNTTAINVREEVQQRAEPGIPTDTTETNASREAFRLNTEIANMLEGLKNLEFTGTKRNRDTIPLTEDGEENAHSPKRAKN